MLLAVDKTVLVVALSSPQPALYREDRVLGGHASGEQGSTGRNWLDCPHTLHHTPDTLKRCRGWRCCWRWIRRSWWSRWLESRTSTSPPVLALIFLFPPYCLPPPPSIVPPPLPVYRTILVVEMAGVEDQLLTAGTQIYSSLTDSTLCTGKSY